jgi:hypothetical protein
METKICNACQIEKTIDSFYRCKGCHQGRATICKICKMQGKKSQKVKETLHPFNQEFRRSEKQHYTLAGCTLEDYLQMYDIMRLIGYDVEKGDIPQQFLDRHNPNLKKPMKYKKRDYKTENHYLPDGSINPLSRQKKTLTPNE